MSGYDTFFVPALQLAYEGENQNIFTNKGQIKDKENSGVY